MEGSRGKTTNIDLYFFMYLNFYVIPDIKESKLI